MNFPEKLITLRKSRGLSQEQLAERLGVSRQAVSRWEMGETTPDMTNLEGLCTFFGVSADYLIFDRKDTPSKAPEAEKSESECVKDNKFKKTMLLVSSIGFTVAAVIPESNRTQSVLTGIFSR